MPEREYKFHPTRKWKFDFCYPSDLADGGGIAFECEGGTWGRKSRHTTGSGFEKDCEKYNEATRLGWQVYRFTSEQMKNGYVTNFLEQLFKK